MKASRKLPQDLTAQHAIDRRAIAAIRAGATVTEAYLDALAASLSAAIADLQARNPDLPQPAFLGVSRETGLHRKADLT